MAGMHRSPRVVRRAVALAAMVGMLVLIVDGVAMAAGKSVTVTESNGRFQFVSNDVTVGVGQRVTWSNRSNVEHTVTSDNPGGLLSGSLIPDGADYTATFTRVGEYRYHCSIHTYMHGVVHVAAAHVAPHPAPKHAPHPPHLPPTDATGSVTGLGEGSGGPGIATLAAVAGTALVAAGWLTFAIRRRGIRA
jgi:plastocyanin